ncbi:Caltractin [Giardia duodenalis]|uniref:Caltractin n=1 Tax=Giardia intestinalis TaxID=5741 RepID=V6TZ72_GIAIN|nr:Caltractin [Giardia intestinalis]
MLDDTILPDYPVIKAFLPEGRPTRHRRRKR